MIEKYDADELIIERDLNDFLSVLKKFGFIVNDDTEN